MVGRPERVEAQRFGRPHHLQIGWPVARVGERDDTEPD
jgi:hypothetical protein